MPKTVLMGSGTVIRKVLSWLIQIEEWKVCEMYLNLSACAYTYTCIICVRLYVRIYGWIYIAVCVYMRVCT